MPNQFDPNIPSLIGGEVSTVVVTDPAGDFPPFEVGNHVLNRNEAFRLTVEWKVTGALRPLWLAALGGNWNVQVFAESIGGGPEKLLASDNTVSADPAVSDYSVTFTVPGNSLAEGNPGSDVSGIYKLVVAVFLNSNLGAPGFDMTGFHEGPIIQVESPL
jgi:hypothetical protein